MSTELPLAIRIKAARKNAGYKTAKSFIESHEYPHSTYMQYETGRRNPSDDIIKKLAKQFKVNFDWLKYGHGVPLKSGKISNVINGELLDLKNETLRPQNINEELLTLILEKLLILSKEHNISVKNIAQSASTIYSDIIQCEPDPKLQTKMITPLLKAYKRYVLK